MAEVMSDMQSSATFLRDRLKSLCKMFRVATKRRFVKEWCMASVATVEGSAGRTPAIVLNKAPEKVGIARSCPTALAKTESKSPVIANILSGAACHRLSRRAAQTVE
jgi:hypothetical protein